MTKFTFIVLTLLMASPVFADGHAASGDVEAGERLFNRQCVACHVAADMDGNVLAGRNARTGPNLFAISGRQIASVEGFRYGRSLPELGLTGTTWTEDRFIAFVQDPTGWVRETLDDRRAQSKMAFRVRTPEDALNIYAFLASLGTN